jgi:hypothetical protein
MSGRWLSFCEAGEHDIQIDLEINLFQAKRARSSEIGSRVPKAWKGWGLSSMIGSGFRDEAGPHFYPDQLGKACPAKLWSSR